jgi:hypothetical protein
MAGLPGVKAAGAGTSSIININPVTSWGGGFSPFPSWSLGIICTVSAGASLTYSVQVTADQQPSTNGNWNNHDTLVNLTVSANDNVAFPITGIRLNVTAFSSGSVNLGVCIWP